MNVLICKSKIHKARLTSCDLHYEGSLAIDIDLMKETGMYPYEKILVVNATNGERLETYALSVIAIYNLPMPEEWLTVHQAADVSGYHFNYIRQMIRAGKLQARKFGPVWQVSR